MAGYAGSRTHSAQAHREGGSQRPFRPTYDDQTTRDLPVSPFGMGGQSSLGPAGFFPPGSGGNGMYPLGGGQNSREPDPTSLWSTRVWRVSGMLLCLVMVGTFANVGLYSRVGQFYDAAAMSALGYWKHLIPFNVDRTLLEVVSTRSIAVVTTVVVLIALLRRRWMLAARAAFLLLLANVLTQILKNWVLVRPDLSVGYELANSLPSGHTTAAAAAAIAGVMVVPLRYRSAVAVLGATWTALMGIATLINEWHRPSDVLAAIFLAGACAFVVSPCEAHRGVRAGRSLRFLLGMVALLGFLGAMVLLYLATSAYPVPFGAISAADISFVVNNFTVIRFLLAGSAFLGISAASALVLWRLDVLASVRTLH